MQSDGAHTAPRRSAPVLLAAFAVATLLVASDASATSTPTARCVAAKRKVVGRAAKKLAVCDAKAVARAIAPDLACTTRASGLLTRGWARAERGGACAGERTDVEQQLDAHETDLRDRLGDGGPASKCASGKFRDAGRDAFCQLRCSVKAARTASRPTTGRS